MIRVFLILGYVCALFLEPGAEHEGNLIELEGKFGYCQPASLYGKSTVKNLMKDFCFTECYFMDYAEMREVRDKISELIYENDNEFENTHWEIMAISRFTNFEDLYLFNLRDPALIHNFYDVVYNDSLKEYFPLPGININDLNSLLNTTDINFIYDSDILQYCKLFTIFKNPHYHIEFISSINEILVEAIYGKGFYSIKDTINYIDIKVGLPIIEREKTKISVYLNLAKNEKIILLKIVLEGKIVTEYKETEIGEVHNWYGIDY